MSSIENDYNQHTEEEYEQFLEWKEEQLKKQGIDVGASMLGDSIHERTLASYKKLKLHPEDTPYLAVRRPEERLKKMITEIKGKPPEIITIIRKVFRLKDRNTQKEYLVYNYEENFKDNNENERTLDYINVGTHPEVEGKVNRDANHNITGSEITRRKLVFDIPWSSKKFDEIMQKHSSKTNETPEYIVGFARDKGHRTIMDTQEKHYTIRNIEDFKKGTHKELIELGQRALSEDTPSLSRLAQPVAEDPNTSLEKRRRGFISPDKISYSQASYR